MAAELLGSEKEYKKSFDIHTSYKALKKAVQRADEDIWALFNEELVKNVKLIISYLCVNSQKEKQS